MPDTLISDETTDEVVAWIDNDYTLANDVLDARRGQRHVDTLAPWLRDYIDWSQYPLDSDQVDWEYVARYVLSL